MSDPLAYHVVFCTHGFWLPNDPRGSCSTEVRATPLRRFGPATTTAERRSLARVTHDVAARQAAKEVMVYPEVVFDGRQAQSVGKGFGAQTRKSGYVVHACSILPSHVHMVIGRHHYSIDQVVRLLRQAGTLQLLRDGQHPFADQRTTKNRLPSVWAQDYWKTFLYTDEDILRAIEYVEQNPVKEGKRPQRWSFVTPYRFCEG